MPRLVHVCTFLILAALALPGIGYLFEIGSSDDYIRKVEKRVPADFPGANGLTDFGAWAGRLEAAIIDHFPFRSRVIQGVRSFDLNPGGRKTFGGVTLGRDGWLFFRDDFGASLRGPNYVDEFQQRLGDLLAYSEELGKPLVVVVIPPKQTVYEEQLRAPDREFLARLSVDREKFHSALDQFPARSVPRVREELESLKASSPELVYHPQDTHYTHVGAMVVARSIIESLSPGLWQDDAIESERGRPGYGDLVGLAGFGAGWEEWEVVLSSVHRPGISLETRELLSGDDTPTARIRFRMRSDSDGMLIPGKSLVVHDSFIGGFLRESLAQYFESVTFIHIDDLTEMDLIAEMRGYDRTVLQVNERNALAVFAVIWAD